MPKPQPRTAMKPSARVVPPFDHNAITSTIQTAAAASSLSIATLRRREKEGLLRFVKVGKRTLVDNASLRELLTHGSAAVSPITK